MTIDILKDEHWWGGLTDLGSEMPIDEDSNIKITMAPIDQGAFLFVSDKGRYMEWYNINRVDKHPKI